MRDLEDGDHLDVDVKTGRMAIVRHFDGGGISVEPCGWNGLRDWAQWWLRLFERRPEFETREARMLFEAVLKETDNQGEVG